VLRYPIFYGVQLGTDRHVSQGNGSAVYAAKRYE